MPPTLRIAAVAEWIDSRTGARALSSSLLDEPIPGGSRWAYVFGSALLVTLLNQFVTGVLLTVYYVPAVDHAHTTVAYIQKVVPLGWLVRGLHYYGASAIIVVLLLHLAQVYIWGAYKQRREALWLAGVILLNVMLGFGFTGYLLPWDQKAYYGTQVAAGIAGSIPLVGSTVAAVFLGGTNLGQATLSRFFTAHVFLLPAAIVVLTAVHLYFFRFRGPAGPASDAPPERTERFFPGQFFKDTVVAVALLAILADFAVIWPAPLGPKADPSASFVPRPEWYFLWTFQLLKYVPAFVGAVVVPGILMTLLAAAPFLDRSPYRSLRRRLVPVGAFLVVMGALTGLTSYALYQDANDPLIRAQEEAAHRFLAEPFVPDQIGEVSPASSRRSSGTAAPVPDPPEAYTANCAGCHGDRGQGGMGPPLLGVTSKPNRSADDLAKLVKAPESFGLKGMPAFADLSEQDARTIVGWLASTRK